MEGREALTVANAARHAGVSASTIRRWMDGGDLEFRLTQQGHRMTSKEGSHALPIATHSGALPPNERRCHSTLA